MGPAGLEASCLLLYLTYTGTAQCLQNCSNGSVVAAVCDAADQFLAGQLMHWYIHILLP
jgi:hypothetical protein